MQGQEIPFISVGSASYLANTRHRNINRIPLNIIEISMLDPTEIKRVSCHDISVVPVSERQKYNNYRCYRAYIIGENIMSI